ATKPAVGKRVDDEDLPTHAPGSFNDREDVAGSDAVARRHADFLHLARTFGRDVVLHFHRFEHEDRLAGLDGRADLYEHLHDRALHRRGDGPAARSPAA